MLVDIILVNHSWRDDVLINHNIEFKRDGYGYVRHISNKKRKKRIDCVSIELLPHNPFYTCSDKKDKSCMLKFKASNGDYVLANASDIETIIPVDMAVKMAVKPSEPPVE